MEAVRRQGCGVIRETLMCKSSKGNAEEKKMIELSEETVGG